MYDERRRNGELAAAIEEGIEKGIEKGREEGRREAIKGMLAAGIKVDMICSIMNMRKEEVECVGEVSKSQKML